MTEHTEPRTKLADARRVHHYAELAAQAQARPSELAVDPSWRRFGYSAPEHLADWAGSDAAIAYVEAHDPAQVDDQVTGLDLWTEHTGHGYATEA